VARAIDDDGIRLWDRREFQCVVVLGLMGTFVASMLVWIGLDLISPGGPVSAQNRMGIGFLVSLGLYCFAFYLVTWRARPYSSAGWIILTVLALLAFGVILALVAISVWMLAMLVKRGLA
jgi:hypothetical protein